MAAAGTPNLDAALDAGTVVSSGGAETTDFDSMSDLDILNQPDETTESTPTEGSEAAAPATEGGEEEKKEGAEAAAATEGGEQETPEQKAAREEAEREAQMSPADKAVRDLKKSIDANPTLKAELAKNPALSNQIWRNARLAQEGTEYRAIAATPALAQQFKNDSEDLSVIEQHFYAGTPDGYQSLMKQMWEADQVRDAQGKPVIDPATGAPKMQGHWDNFFFEYRDKNMWPAILKIAEQENRGAEIGEAVQLIREFLGELKPGEGTPVERGAASDPDSNLTPQQRAELAEARSLKRQQAQSVNDSSAKELETFNQSVVKEVDSSAMGFLTARAKALAPALSETLQKKVASDTWEKIKELAKSDTSLARLRNNILKPRTPEAAKRWAAEARRFAEVRYREIMQDVVKEYGAGAIDASKAATSKLSQQATRTEVKGGAGAVPSKPAEDNVVSQVSEGDKLSMQLRGRKLSTDEIMEIETVLPKLRELAAAKK